MDKNQINEAMSYIDDSIIEETQKVRENKKGPYVPLGIRLVRTPVGRGILAAASLVIVVGVGAIVISQSLGKTKAMNAAPESVMMSMSDDYRGFSVQNDAAFDEEDGRSYATPTMVPATVPYVASNDAVSKEVEEGSAVDSKSMIKSGSTLNAADYLFTSCKVDYTDAKASTLNIEFELSNTSPFYIRFGDAYQLQRLGREDYETVEPTSEVLVKDILHVMMANDTSSIFTQKISLSPYEGLLKPGFYRVTKEIYLIPDGFEGADPIYYLVNFEFEIQ